MPPSTCWAWMQPTPKRASPKINAKNSFSNSRQKLLTSGHFCRPNDNRVGIRVARWYTFSPKIPLWVNFGGP
jgi:hypothetical protein